MTVILIHEVFGAQDSDSSVAEFILSGAEGLFRNDRDRFEILTKPGKLSEIFVLPRLAVCRDYPPSTDAMPVMFSMFSRPRKLSIASSMWSGGRI